MMGSLGKAGEVEVLSSDENMTELLSRSAFPSMRRV